MSRSALRAPPTTISRPCAAAFDTAILDSLRKYTGMQAPAYKTRDGHDATPDQVRRWLRAFTFGDTDEGFLGLPLMELTAPVAYLSAHTRFIRWVTTLDAAHSLPDVKTPGTSSLGPLKVLQDCQKLLTDSGLNRRETVRANSSWRVVRELKFLQKIRVERRQSVRKVLELSLKVPQDGSEPGGQSGVEGREALRVGREVDRAQGHLSDERRACQGDARGAYAEVKEDDVGGVNVLGAASPTPLLRREDFDIRQSRLPHGQQVGRRGRPRAPQAWRRRRR